MKNLELKEVHNGLEVIEDGQAVGRVTRISPSSYSWHSYLAKQPLDKGRCEKEAGALAHLGYKRRTVK